MIELQTLNVVSDSGFDNIDNDSNRIEVYANTALAEIVATLATDAIIETSSRSTIVDDDKISDYTTQVEEHALCLKDAKDLAVRSVRQLTDIVRNTINPHVRKVLKCIDNRSNHHNGISLGYNIKLFNISTILTDPTVLNILNVWKGKIPEGDIKGRGVGLLEHDYIQSCFQVETSDRNSSTDYDSNLSKLTEFLNGEVSIERVQDHDLLAQAVLVLAVTKTPPPGVSSNLTQWENNRNNLMANCVAILNKVISSYNRNIEGQMLYADSRSENTKEILVFDKIYRSMLEQGLTPEAVMGNQLLGRRYLSHQLVDAEVIKKCEYKYNLEKTAAEAANRISERASLFSNIKSALIRDLNEIAESEAWPVDGDSRDKANARLIKVRDAIFKTKGIEYKSTEDIVAACLLATWYAHTDAVTLMDLASRLGVDNPELSPEEIYTLAKIEYIGLYVASQLRLVRLSGDE